MTQILNSLPTQATRIILCNYKNTELTIQIIQIVNIPNWHFERVVFPFEQLLFEALPEAVLEIHNGDNVGGILRDCITCSRLKVNSTNEGQ